MARAYEVKRSGQQINDVLNAASESEEAGTTRWRGMTYEQGVSAALRWVLGESEDNPMED